MSYTPTNWATGDSLTAEKLNKLENGIVNMCPMVVKVSNPSGDRLILNRTWQEIKDAFDVGKAVILDYGEMKNFSSQNCVSLVVMVNIEGSSVPYKILSADELYYSTDDPDEFPLWTS